jgi:hypothetical protein
MFRAAALSIVLTLAVGPNASLLCRVVCDQPQADASVCNHKGPTTIASVAGANSCDAAGLGVAEFLPRDIRPDVSFGKGHHPNPKLGSALAQPAVDARPGDKAEREWPIDKQRLTSNLRL